MKASSARDIQDPMVANPIPPLGVNNSGGVLHSQEISRLHLISDMDPESLKEASYDLRLGEAHYVFNKDSSKGEGGWFSCYIGSDKEGFNKGDGNGNLFEAIDPNDRMKLVIPPFGSAFVQLHETVDTLTALEKHNELVVGRFDLRLSMVHKGLISQQATQVEPMYKGRLFCFVHNLSNSEVRISYLERFATIEFERVAFENAHEKESRLLELKSRKKVSKYATRFHCTENGIEDIRYFATHIPLPDDCGLLGMKSEVDRALNNHTDQLSGDSKFVNAVAAQVDGKQSARAMVLAAFISGICAVVVAIIGGYFSYTALQHQIDGLSSAVKDIRTDISNGQEYGVEAPNPNRRGVDAWLT